MQALLIEDDSANRFVLENQLEALGFHVTACSDAETALETYQQLFYPLIVVDLDLPGMNGIEFTQQVRSLSRGEQSMILLITGYDQPEHLSAAFEAGVDDYAGKPLNTEQLRMRLDIIERRRKIHQQRQQAEADLLRLEKAVETIRLGVTIADIHGTILYTNPAEARMHGYTHTQELIGRDVECLAPHELRSPLTLEQLDQKSHWARNSVNIRKDQSQFPVRLVSAVVRDSAGKPAAIVTICEDVTDRMKAEQTLQESEERFRTTFEQAAVGIAHIAPDGRYLRVNQRFCDIVGYDKEELLRLTVQEMTCPDDLPQDLQSVQQLLNDSISTYALEKRLYS